MHWVYSLSFVLDTFCWWYYWQVFAILFLQEHLVNSFWRFAKYDFWRCRAVWISERFYLSCNIRRYVGNSAKIRKNMLISFFITLGFCQFATGRQEQYKIFNGKIRQEKFTTTNYCVGSVSYARMLLLALFDIKHCNVLIYI